MNLKSLNESLKNINVNEGEIIPKNKKYIGLIPSLSVILKNEKEVYSTLYNDVFIKYHGFKFIKGAKTLDQAFVSDDTAIQILTYINEVNKEYITLRLAKYDEDSDEWEPLEQINFYPDRLKETLSRIFKKYNI